MALHLIESKFVGLAFKVARVLARSRMAGSALASETIDVRSPVTTAINRTVA